MGATSRARAAAARSTRPATVAAESRARPWRVLGAVAFANLVVAALHFGLAAAAPLVRDELALSTAGLGLLLAAPPLGLMLGTYLWGELGDRTSERWVLAGAFTGFTLACTALSAAGARGDAPAFAAALLVAGFCGSAAHSAGGRAISAAFTPERHGTVLGIRHTAIPIGGAIGGLAVPALVHGGGLGAIGLAAAALGALAMAAVAACVPSAHVRGTSRAATRGVPSPLRHRPLWLLAVGAACLAFVQLGLGSFLTLHLVDEAGIGVAAAAAVFTATQLLSALGRIVLGYVSDRLGRRVVVLQGVGVVTSLLLVAALVARDAQVEAAAMAAALVVVGSCNGVVVAAAASLAPAGRTGATLGMQTTANAAACTLAPVALGLVLAGATWGAAQATLLLVLAASAVCLHVLAPHAGCRATHASGDTGGSGAGGVAAASE